MESSLLRWQAGGALHSRGTRATRSSTKKGSFRILFELLLTRLNLKVFGAWNWRMALWITTLPPRSRAFPEEGVCREEYSAVLIELPPQFDMRRLVVNYRRPQPDGLSLRPHRAQSRPFPPASFASPPPRVPEILTTNISGAGCPAQALENIFFDRAARRHSFVAGIGQGPAIAVQTVDVIRP